MFCQCVLAELFGQTGHPVDGLAVLARRFQRRDAIYAPEILRLEGELRRRLSSPDTREIERCLFVALGLASQRSEKSIELRAATSLAQFRCHQGDHALAHKLLANREHILAVEAWGKGMLGTTLRYDRGRRNPTIVTLFELAQALGVSHVDLVVPDGEQKKRPR